MKINQVYLLWSWQRYVKCSRHYKIEHHKHFAWCYKANFKINLSYLETKQGKSYTHMFKCLNCKDDHQADFNTCPF